MRNELPKRCRRLRPECGIINLDDASGGGTHWVAYYKKANDVYYFDSFGDLRPPKEFVDYVGGKLTNIYFNYDRFQDYNTVNCGQLCLQFLEEINAKFSNGK